jgi:uncharacterized membrane protein YdjX (TVP38/TMEM64 family)
MEEAIQQPGASKKRAAIKASIFVAFIIGAVALVRYTPIKDYLTPEAMGRFLDTAGIWASLVFMLVYAVGVSLFIPGTLLTGLGAAIFGPYRGFLYVWVGAMLGASSVR